MDVLVTDTLPARALSWKPLEMSPKAGRLPTVRRTSSGPTIASEPVDGSSSCPAGGRHLSGFVPRYLELDEREEIHRWSIHLLSSEAPP